jgi:uncharacterized membrane protein YgdD (TMEM256/DUF423 family)
MERLLFIASGVFGFLTVALGAFGAHAVRGRLLPLADGAARLEWWQTATLYQGLHALALGLAAILYGKSGAASASVAGWSFAAGILLFSGSLYTMALTGIRMLGAVTPLGGLAFLIGWSALTFTAFRLP